MKTNNKFIWIAVALVGSAIGGYLADITGALAQFAPGSGVTVTNSVVVDAPLSGAGTAASHLTCPTADTDTDGCLGQTDWDTFNGKVAATRAVGTGTATTTGLSGGGDLSADRNLVCETASATSQGCVSTGGQTFAGDKTFNGEVTSTNAVNVKTNSILYNSDADKPLRMSDADGYQMAPRTPLPTCGTVGEGTFFILAGAAGDASQVCYCSKDGTNFEWINLMVPGTRTGDTTTCPASGAQ